MPFVHMFSANAVNILTSASIRAICLALLAGAFLWIIRRRSVQLQHAVWTSVLIAMLALPLISFFAPALHLRGVPQQLKSPIAASPAKQVKAAQPIRIDFSNEVMMQPLAVTPTNQPSWPMIAIVVYLAGVVAFLMRLVLGIRLSYKLAASSTTLRDSGANRALEEVARQQSAPYPLPEVLESDRTSVPCVVGCERPAILLPIEWAVWDESKLQAVLAHELTHVRRGDWHFVLLAAFNKSIFWFHPLAWWLERRLTALSEHASDEGALLVTRDAASYASVLLEVSTAVNPAGTRLPVPVAPMAAAHPVARRIHRVLGLSKRSSGILPARGWLAVAAVALPLVCAVGAAQAPPPQAPQAVPNISAQAWVQDGFKTTPVEALVMEHQLTSDPHNLTVRGKLLSYYLYNADEDGIGRHALWVIQNHPDSVLADHPAVATPYFGGKKYLQQTKASWLQQAGVHNNNPRVLGSAARFVQQMDPPAAEQLLKRAYELDRSGRWRMSLAIQYSQMLMADSYFRVGVNILHLWPEANQAYTSRIKSDLLQSNDADLVGQVGSGLSTLLQNSSFGGPDPNPAMQARLSAVDDAEALFRRAQFLAPGEPRWPAAITQLEEVRKRVAEPSWSAPRPVRPQIATPGAEAAQIRVGGAVQNAKLQQSTPPDYPPLARQARIQGVVRLQVVISADGSVANIQLRSGHPLLVPAATEAVKTWRYQPTYLNGVPVAVLTEVDVNFSLDP